MLNRVIILLLIVALLLSGYALWDTWQIYSLAENDLRYKPELRAGGASDPAFSELIALNPDVKAWLTVDQTGIDYPVVQGKDNFKYVNCNVFGNYSLSGSVFLDYRCQPDFSGSYSILYGHHMEGGAMFGDLLKYEEKAFFETHTSGVLITEEQTYRLEIFAYLQVNAYDDLFDPEIEGEAFVQRLKYIRGAALHYRDIGMTENDRMLILSTCSSSSTNGRGVAAARLTVWSE